MQTVIARCAALLAAWPLTACIPIPYPVLPGARMGSHSKVPAEVPSWLVAGQTTRQEVLTALGKPDWVGANRRSVAYWSAHGPGYAGVLIIAGGGISAEALYAGHEIREFRRLTINFSETDVVTNSKLTKMSCRWTITSTVNGPYKPTFKGFVHVPCALGEDPFGDLEPAASADSVSSHCP